MRRLSPPAKRACHFCDEGVDDAGPRPRRTVSGSDSTTGFLDENSPLLRVPINREDLLASLPGRAPHGNAARRVAKQLVDGVRQIGGIG